MRPSISSKAATLTCTLFLVLAAACGGPDQSPEARIRSLIAEGEKAAESRDISLLKELISDHYQDRRGYTRQTVLRIAQGMFLRNRRVHLLTMVRDLQVQDTTASARVLVAMSGRYIETVQGLVDVRADLLRFDIEFEREGQDWLVRSADWRRAELNDFL